MGDAAERRLVNALDACGFVAMRAPSSGSATTRELPDVLALRSAAATGDYDVPFAEVLAVEEKTTSGTTAYADEAEVEALETFGAAAGARVLLGANFKRPGVRTPFYLVPPENCRMTDEGNYGIPESDADERAVLLVWSATSTKPARVELNYDETAPRQ